MTWEGWFVLAVVGVVLVALVKEQTPPDLVLLAATLVVCLVGIIKPRDVFTGFSNEGMLTVAALFVVAAALRETGAVDVLGGRILGRVRTERAALLRMSPQIAGLSAFLNNTFVVAMLLPVVTDWCRKNRVSPSRLLMPLSYMTVLGGCCTLIGTSTNLVVSGLVKDSLDHAAKAGTLPPAGLRPMQFFELAYVGIPATIVGVAYLILLGRKLLPDRKDLLEQLGERSREYLVDMVIQPGCRLIGQSVQQAGLRHLPGLFLVEITREHEIVAPVQPDELLRAGDRLTFTGVVSTIVDLERIPGLAPAADEAYAAEKAQRRERRFCEAVISSTSPLVGKNIRQADFRAVYNAAIIAVHRGGARLTGRIGDIVLRPGDTLLLQTGPHFARAHRNNPDFYLVGSIEEARPVRHERSTWSLVLLVALVVLMASEVIPVVVAAFLVACVMLATRCISAADARQSIDWQTLITIAASFGLGLALERSGAAATVAGGVVDLTRAWGPVGVLAAVYLATLMMTEMITNNAAAVLMFPFAMAVSAHLQVSPMPFMMAITFAASYGFATPFGYQTHLMVFGPGGYRFTDFVRVGVPLDVLCGVVAVLLIPKVWPF